MDADRASFDLLAHFDASVAQPASRPLSVRGVGWVLRWATALAVLFFAGSVLVEFGYCLAAERMLARAARAGAVEATLPRATNESVAATINRRLGSLPSDRVQIRLAQNDVPVRGVLRPVDGDRLSVTVVIPVDAVVPRWVQTGAVWRGDSSIEVRAEKRMPGRELSK